MATELKPEEQELLGFEVEAFLGLLSDEVRPRYAPIAAAVAAGELPDDALAPVGDLLEAGLQTGRIRKLHRASGEGVALRLFGKTPSGQALAEQTGHVNRALEQLAGQEVESLRVTTRTPGTYLLHVSTDACELTVRFGPDGANVESVSLGI